MKDTLTELETKVMQSIPEDYFYEDGFSSTLWLDAFIDTVTRHTKIQPNQTRALLVTLQTKEYIGMLGGKDGYLWLSDKGKTWLLENGLVNQDGKPLD